MIVENNFLDNNQFKKINHYITHGSFPWYMHDDIKFFKLIHYFIKEENKKIISSPYITLVLSELLQKIKVKKIYTARVDCYFKSKESYDHEPNIDIDENSKNFIGILEMNSTNGYTSVIGQDKIKSEENRFICMKSNTPYFHVSHTDCDKRIIITLEYSL